MYFLKRGKNLVDLKGKPVSRYRLTVEAARCGVVFFHSTPREEIVQRLENKIHQDTLDSIDWDEKWK